ncbi:MAG: hypothetical protein ACXAC6_07230 [Candidatus Hodarchaeales archaeon]|jgi:hypothetical protein
MTTTFPNRGSNPDNHFQPFCLEQPQKQSRSHIKTIGPFILITLIVGLIILLPQGKEDISIVIPPSPEEWRYSSAKSLVQTTEGGFALAGFTGGPDIDSDMWLVKTDANGVAQWNQTYGRTGNDEVNDLVQTIDGGFALVGSTDSYGLFGRTGFTDMWFVKTNANGVAQWNQTYGRGEDDYGNAVIQTVDGRFVLGGETYCRGWLMKTDASGVMIWNQKYGHTDPDEVNDLVQTIDGGFALVGDTERTENGVIRSSGILLVKTDANGVIQWIQTYKGAGDVTGNAVIQTVDGGFALVGSTVPYGLYPRTGYTDMWLVKTDANGVMIWNQTYGGIQVDGGDDLVQTIDGGFALVGSTSSFGPVEPIVFDQRTSNMWLVKTDATGNVTWNQTYGGPDEDRSSVLVQTTDGGFALAGFKGLLNHDSSMWLMKTDATGNHEWNQTYRDPGWFEVTATITPTPSLGPISLLVAAVVLTTWYKRHKKLE